MMFNSLKEYCSKHSAEIGLGILIIYVLLLAFGTIGEIFEIEWILKFPLFTI